MFDLRYHELVAREDIPKIPASWREKIRRAVEGRLATLPDLYGRPLRRSLKGYRKLRVGDYRVIYRIESAAVKIFVIQHRSVAYRAALKRIS